jgi:small subunit ribosomal protein S16
LIDIDETKALEWLRKGAQPSQSVQVLLTKAGIWEKFEAERPQKPRGGPKPKGAKAAS